MFKNVIFCTRHTGEQRELKTLPQVRPSHRVGLTPLLLQPGALRFLCRQEAVWETVIGDLIFFFLYAFKKNLHWITLQWCV